MNTEADRIVRRIGGDYNCKIYSNTDKKWYEGFYQAQIIHSTKWYVVNFINDKDLTRGKKLPHDHPDIRIELQTEE